MLYQTASRLQQTDFTNAEQTEAILAQTQAILDLYDKHAGTEDYFVLPAIEQYEPSVTTLFAEEHVQDHALSEKLRAIINGLQTATAPEDKRIWASLLPQVFIEFMVFNLHHMAKEEIVLNKLLWRYYSDEELHGITQKILGYLAPETLHQYSIWMLRALSNNEISEWLKQIKTSAPEFMFALLLNSAEKELPAHRWNAIQESIRDGALAA